VSNKCFCSCQSNNDADNAHLHGCNVLHELVYPWGCSDRIVVADSYFASVPAAIRLFGIGLRFIGVLKTAIREYPMDYLSHVLLPADKGDRRGVYTVDGTTGTRLLAFVWCDRDRRYFVTTCSNIQDGAAIDRVQWRQVDTAPNANPSRVDVHIRQPRACEIYYSGCSAIDRHNRCRQAGLQIEKKIKVLSYDKRVNTSMFGMIVVDALNLFKGVSQGSTVPRPTNEREFFSRLAEQLIDNTFDTRDLRHRKSRSEAARESASHSHTIPSSQQLIGTTPTKRHKKNHPKHLLQGRCLVCRSLSTHVCRECQRNLGTTAQHQAWICCSAGKVCMGRHIMVHHPDMVAHAPDDPIDYRRVI